MRFGTILSRRYTGSSCQQTLIATTSRKYPNTVVELQHLNYTIMFNTLGRRKTAVFALISAAVLYAFQLFPFFVKDPVIGGNVGHRVDDEPPRKSDCYNSKTKDGSIFSFASPSAHSTTVDDAPSTDLLTRLLHPGSPPGFTTLSRLYFYQGTLYAVVKDEESKAAYPHMKFILSRPVEAGPLPSEPTDRVGFRLLSGINVYS